jgi:predicted porin
MKRILLIVALSGFGHAAHAQSSVTLYGLLDEGITRASNVTGHIQTAMSSGVMQGNRWGIRGVEDLGRQMKAIFRLENGFDISTGALGQGGLEFGRTAWVGLQTIDGTITFGRQYDATVDLLGPMQAGNMGATGLAAHPGDIDNMLNSYRVNNAVKFKSATYSGLTVEMLYSLGGVAGSLSQKQVFSAGIGFEHGAARFAITYVNARNPNVSYFGTSSSTTLTAATTNITSRVFRGFASARTYQSAGAGGTYAFGPNRWTLLYSHVDFSEMGDTESGPNTLGYHGSANFNDVEGDWIYSLTQAVQFVGVYNYLGSQSFGGHGGMHYHQGSLGVDYALSKLTDIYLVGLYQRASGTDSTGKPAVADLLSLGASDSASQTAVRIGLRHKF